MVLENPAKEMKTSEYFTEERRDHVGICMKAPLLIAVSPTVTVYFGRDWLLHMASPDGFLA